MSTQTNTHTDKRVESSHATSARPWRSVRTMSATRLHTITAVVERYSSCTNTRNCLQLVVITGVSYAAVSEAIFTIPYPPTAAVGMSSIFIGTTKTTFLLESLLPPQPLCFLFFLEDPRKRGTEIYFQVGNCTWLHQKFAR